MADFCVYAFLGKGDEALHHAHETMRLTNEHGFKDFDLAYAYEAMARSYATLKNENSFSEFYSKAKDEGELINDSKDKKYFIDDLASKPWFGFGV